ncbi:hypothetical protein CERSUDRAFT_104791 [Gelatoporia subvermispora B]|uniref:HORMA domain-containing protein n=1 Tax=Ceriporiopsis subvermispora (strain B) TaxID=914234 RepID=M2RH77_CERS8|nr:hypothetical protein CERSUDRAFT_104791 [Gelatoporia subvermispora B]
MQAQSARTEQHQAAVTSQQSLQSIQTLLRAGLGCITYLRSLLPADNFSESYLTSSASESFSSQPSVNGSFASDCSKRNVSGFKIMTVTRGFTEEADKLLDYLEQGIFDAVEKQYLRSFIFAIYLYYKVPGTDTTVPIMSLGEDLMKLSLGGKATVDPVSTANKAGTVPTLGEVKRSLKTLVKNLIQATTQMDALPKRRFATFKLFYYDNTPEDYEPAHFRPGDVGKDKWFFTTHDKGEVPERCSVGSVQTGYHGVDVRITSVSGYLPSTEDNNAPFLGTTQGNAFTAPALSPVEEAAARLQQVEAQHQDALNRRVAWDADEGMCDEDADGEADPDVDPRKFDSKGDFLGPIGVRDEEGKIQSLSQEEQGGHRESTSVEQAQYAGQCDTVPTRIAQLAQANRHSTDFVPETQPLEETQVLVSPTRSGGSPSPLASPTPRLRHSSRAAGCSIQSLPPSDIGESIQSEPSLNPNAQSIDTQLVKELIMEARACDDDSEMLDLETQVVPLQTTEDSIRSFSDTPQGAQQDQHEDVREGILECECGVAEEDTDTCMCDAGCNRWFHTWCMGFHSAKDERIPKHFRCFDCRVKADKNWELIVLHDLYPRMIAKFRDLAIMRRAIKVFETHNPDTLSAFTRLLGCNTAVSGQLFKRLEAEGFIATETKELDELGLIETTTHTVQKKGKGNASSKKKQPQRRKPLQKPKYVFNVASKQTEAYKDYFNPDPEVEKRLLALAEMEETQLAVPPPGISDRGKNGGTDERKRKGTADDTVKTSKKIKISVGPAVDLGD